MAVAPMRPATRACGRHRQIRRRHVARMCAVLWAVGRAARPWAAIALTEGWTEASPRLGRSAPIVWAMSSTRARAPWRCCCGVCARARPRRQQRETARHRGSCDAPRCSPPPSMPQRAPRTWQTSGRRRWKWARALIFRSVSGGQRSHRLGTDRRAMSSLQPPAAALADCERCVCGCGDGVRRAGSSSRLSSGVERARQRRRLLARSSRPAETPCQPPASGLPTSEERPVGRSPLPRSFEIVTVA